MALVAVRLGLHPQSTSREWLYIEPHGHVLHPAPSSHDAAVRYRGVPRVAWWGPTGDGLDQYMGVLGQYIGSYLTRPCQYNGLRINNYTLFSISAKEAISWKTAKKHENSEKLVI